MQDAPAQEIGPILEDNVVLTAEDINLCMITGPGWPMHIGGITPYLNRVGAAQRANGKAFHRAS